jgi:hypothetical protein
VTDKTNIIVIEHGMNVIIKEKEGIDKRGEPKQIRISNFKNPNHALNYLKQKFGLTVEEST